MTQKAKAYIALSFICLVWGTTYMAIRIGVMHYPAFLFAGTRQSVAGVILMSLALSTGRGKDFSRHNILRQMWVGFLMLTLGNGCVTWGEQYVPSGISALICSLMPLFAVLFNLLFSGKDKFNLPILLGMALGVSGVGIIFRNNLAMAGNPAYLAGIGATVLATAAWALGSIFNRRNTDPVNPMLNAGMQLFFGGLFMLCFSPVADNYHNLQLWNTSGLLALGYLIIFGSVLAYAAYMYSLSKLPVGIATIYAYINPLIAVVSGSLVLGETLNMYTGIAFLTIIISVYLVNRGYRKQHQQLQDVNNAEGFPESAPVES